MKQSKEALAHIENLRNAKDFFENLKDERESYYEDRSEKWQDSDKGSDYQSETEVLDEQVNAISDAIDELETLFSE